MQAIFVGIALMAAGLIGMLMIGGPDVKLDTDLFKRKEDDQNKE